MPLVTQPLRDEHLGLLPHLEEIRVAADAVGNAPASVVRQQVNECHEFLAHHLVPHARAEEQALYPVVANILGAPEATATMSRDHVAIGSLIEELGRLRSALSAERIQEDTANALRRVLYGLYVLVSVHFAKEEEIYLPLLDAHLSPQQADELFSSMGHAAMEARHESPLT